MQPYIDAKPTEGPLGDDVQRDWTSPFLSVARQLRCDFHSPNDSMW